MCGFIVASGLLTAYVANTALRARAPDGVFAIVISGLASIGWMAAVNLAIDSEFKWPLCGGCPAMARVARPVLAGGTQRVDLGRTGRLMGRN